MTVDREVYVWKESSRGYYLHQKLRFTTAIVRARPILSPSGESIIASIRPTIHLWTTKDQISSSSNPSTQDDGKDFILTLSPNKTLAAFARNQGTVTLLDLGSGEPRLTIDTGMWREVLCLGMTDDTVVVVYGTEIVTWNVPAEKCTPDARANINDSVQTTTLDRLSARIPYASLSPDLGHVVIVASWYSPGSDSLVVYDVSTGRGVMEVRGADTWVKPQLTRGGHQLWDVGGPSVKRWNIVQGHGHHFPRSHVKPELLTPTECPSDVFPWQSTRGYKVTDDGWILSPAQKRLLWLPHDWRSHERNRMWNGQFLGLLHGGLQEVVILEFLD